VPSPGSMKAGCFRKTGKEVRRHDQTAGLQQVGRGGAHGGQRYGSNLGETFYAQDWGDPSKQREHGGRLSHAPTFARSPGVVKAMEEK
jgi:hypothetical protein